MPRWGRARLLLHGVLTGLLAAAVTGTVDSVTSRNEFLDVGFLWMAVLGWAVCLLPAAVLLSALGAVIVRPQEQGWRSPPALAAVLTTAIAGTPLLLVLLVHLNVGWLPTAMSTSSLLANAVVAVVALLLGILVVRLLAGCLRRAGMLYRLPVSAAGCLLGSACVLLGAHLSWPAGARSIAPGPLTARPDSPNVVLILIDTLRLDHLSGQGYGRATSPFLDRLAGEGTRFTGCRSQSSYTKPSVASLLTSRHVSGHRAGNMLSVLSEDLVTLPEVFRTAGYRTAMVVANPVVSRRHGFSQGAELFHCLESSLLGQSRLVYGLAKLSELGAGGWGVDLLRRLLGGLERSLLGLHGAKVTSLTAPQVVEAFLAWRADIGDAPYFAYLHLMEPHAPYAPPPQWAGRFHSPEEPFVSHHPDKAGIFLPFSPSPPLSEVERRGMVRAYDAEIAFVDQVIGELIDSIRRGPDGDSTIIAVTSDHGEEFYEHHGWGHGHSLHRELLQVPLLLLGPGIPRGWTVTRPVQLIDLAPTLLAEAGLAVPGTMVGRPLRSQLGKPGQEPSPSLAELQYGRTYWARALQHGGMKLIVSRLGERRHVALYDTESDPGETLNLADSRPRLVKELHDRMNELVNRSKQGAVAAQESAPLDETTEERLRALGYVQE